MIDSFQEKKHCITEAEVLGKYCTKKTPSDGADKQTDRHPDIATL